MSFERVDHARMPEGIPWVSIGVEPIFASSRRHPQVTIRLSRSLSDFLGINDDNTVALEIGRGSDQGKIRLRTVGKGGLTPDRKSEVSRAVKFSSGWVGGPLDKHKTERLANFRVRPGIDSEGPHLDIELPEWAGGVPFEIGVR